MPSFLDLSLYRRIGPAQAVSLVAALATAAAVVLACGWSLTPHEGVNTVQRRMRHLTLFGKTHEDVRIVILGNSLPMEAVRAPDLTVATVNLAMGGADYVQQEGILEGALQRYPRLSVVVLGIDELPMLNGNHGREKYTWAAFGLGHPVDARLTTELDERLALSIAAPLVTRPLVQGPKWEARSLIRGVIPLKQQQDPDRAVRSTKAGRPLNTPPPPRWKPHEGAGKMNAYDRGFRNSTTRNQHLPENRAALQRLARTLGERGIRLALIQPPTVSTFHTARPTWMQLIREEAAETAVTAWARGWERGMGTTPPPVVRFDDEAATGLKGSDFHDPNHLSNLGAERYTARIAERWAGLVERVDGPKSR